MIFIEPTTRVRDFKDVRSLRHDKAKINRPEQDHLTLSDAASEVHEIILSDDQAYELTSTDTILANLIEHILNSATQAKVGVISIQQIDTQAKGWQIQLQTPPRQSTSANQSYAPVAKQHIKGSKNQLIKLPIVSQDQQNSIWSIIITCTHSALASDLIRMAQQEFLPPMITPYTSDMIEKLPSAWAFIVDQDGEPDPLRELYQGQETKNWQGLIGLQWWFDAPEQRLPIVVSDQQFGYVYVGNFVPQHPEERSIQEFDEATSKDTSA